MSIKSFAMALLGVTILYAGLLTLSNDVPAGVLMMLAGAILAGVPSWRFISQFWTPSGGMPGGVGKGGKRRGKTRLTVVKGKDEEQRTYH